MIEYPKKVELHKYSMDGRTIALRVRGLLLFELDDLAQDVLRICDGSRHRDNVINALKNKYSAEDIVATLNQLEETTLLVEASSGEPSIIPPSEYPIKTIELHVCHDCNLKCLYCYGDEGTYGSDRTYMNEEVAEAAVDFLIEKSGNVKRCSIVFFGGEPLMNMPIIKHVVNYARRKAKECDKEISFNMTTNGLLLDDDVIKYLNKEGISVMVSMDGPKDVQDRMRPCIYEGVSSYDYMLPRIRTFIKSRRGRVSARATVTRYNLDILGIAKHLIEIGFRNVFLSPVSTAGEEFYSLGKKEMSLLREGYDKVTAHFMKNIEKGIGIGIPYLRASLGRLYSPGPPVLYPCGAGRAMLAVSPEGDIFPCHRFAGIAEFQMGNVLTGWDSRFHEEILANHVDTRKVCKSCWARYWCGGGCYAHNYSVNADPYMPCGDWCQLTKHTIKSSVLMYLKTHAQGDEALEELYRHLFPQPPSYSLSTEESAITLTNEGDETQPALLSGNKERLRNGDRKEKSY